MSALVNAIRTLLLASGGRSREFGWYAGQLVTGHGVRSRVVHLMEHPLPGERFEKRIMVDVFDRKGVWAGLKPTLDYEPTVFAGADQKDSKEAEEKTLISEWRSLLKKLFDRAEPVTDVQ